MDQKKKINDLHSKLIGDKLKQLQGAFGSSGATDAEQRSYRDEQARERERAEKRPRGESTRLFALKPYLEGANIYRPFSLFLAAANMSGDAASLAASGMNGSTMQIMMGIDGDDDVDEKSKKRHKKDKKKDKKKEKKKEKKRQKKEAKKRKKAKKHNSRSVSPSPGRSDDAASSRHRRLASQDSRDSGSSSDSSSSSESEDEKQREDRREKKPKTEKKPKAAEEGEDKQENATMWGTMGLFKNDRGFLAR